MQTPDSGFPSEAAPEGDSPTEPAAGYALSDIREIASLFAIPPPLSASDFTEKGNIHEHTYLIRDCVNREYLLQSINQRVFTRPESTMAAMIACIAAQEAFLRDHPLPEGDEWSPIRLIPTVGGALYLRHADRHGSSVWRLMEKIPGCRTYKSLSEIPDARQRLRVAEEAGRGLARYGSYTDSVDATQLASPLPGYRDTALYYAQMQSVLHGSRTLEAAAGFLPEDAALRHSTERHFLVHLPEDGYQARMEDPAVRSAVELALREREFGMTLLRKLAEGRIRTVAIHGDTKLDNFLFCTRTNRVKAVVDLDTIMPHTWLSDWGDMVRSLVNVAGEKEPDLDRVQVDAEVFAALARGFLSAAGEITAAEVELMVDAVQIIALELGIRFLTDYLRGDTYFKLAPQDPPVLNRTRGLVQLTLFQRLRDHAPAARTQIAAVFRG